MRPFNESCYRRELSHISMYIDEQIFVPNLSANHKAGAAAKLVNKLYVTVVSKVSSLSCVGDAAQKPLRILHRYGWTLNLLVLPVDNDDRRLSDLQSQPVRPIGVNKMK